MDGKTHSNNRIEDSYPHPWEHHLQPKSQTITGRRRVGGWSSWAVLRITVRTLVRSARLRIALPRFSIGITGGGSPFNFMEDIKINMKQNFTITTKGCLGFQSIQAAGWQVVKLSSNANM